MRPKLSITIKKNIKDMVKEEQEEVMFRRKLTWEYIINKKKYSVFPILCDYS